MSIRQDIIKIESFKERGFKLYGIDFEKSFIYIRNGESIEKIHFNNLSFRKTLNNLIEGNLYKIIFVLSSFNRYNEGVKETKIKRRLDGLINDYSKIEINKIAEFDKHEFDKIKWKGYNADIYISKLYAIEILLNSQK